MERRVGAEEEDGEEGGHDDDHDAALDRLLLGWPDDLRGFRADLLEELAWTDLCHSLTFETCETGRMIRLSRTRIDQSKNLVPLCPRPEGQGPARSGGGRHTPRHG